MSIKTKTPATLCEVMGKEKNSLFSEREQEIIMYLSEGKNSKEIAGILNISVHTVDTHRRKMLAKFNVNNVAHLVGLAFREGLLS